MKSNIFKIMFLFSLVFLAGCENEDDPRFQPNVNIGWAELTTTSSTTGPRDESTDIPVNVTTPIFDTFTIDYVLTAVEGDFTQYVSSSTGTITIVPSESRISQITIPLNGLDDFRDFETVFDVTITASSSPNISIGLEDDSRNITQRVTIPCNEPDTLDELITNYPNILTGDYYLADEDNSGVIPYFGSTTPTFDGQEITIAIGNNPNERVFDAVLYPGTGFDTLITVTLEIITDENVGKVVILKNSVAPFTLGCSGGISGLDLFPYTIDPDDESQEDLDYTQWEICNGGPDSYVINAFETTSGCGGLDDQYSTFSITKR